MDAKYNVSPEMQERLNTTFTHHAPFGDQLGRYAELRKRTRALALDIVRTTPPSREQSLALAKLEEASMYANAAIARNEVNPEDLEEGVGPDSEAPQGNVAVETKAETGALPSASEPVAS